MKFVQAERRVSAPAEIVWQILTSAERLVALDAGITELTGEIAPDARLALMSEVAPGRVFKLRVVAFDPPRHMVWSGGMPLGLFTGRRQFTVGQGDTGCDLKMREEFTGVMSGLIWRTMPDLQPSMDRLADAIKQEAEEMAR